MLQHRIQLFWLTKELFASVLSVDIIIIIIIIICVCHVLYLLVFLLSAFRWRPWMHFILKNISSICLYLTSIVCSHSSLEMFYFFRSIPIFFLIIWLKTTRTILFFNCQKRTKGNLRDFTQRISFVVPAVWMNICFFSSKEIVAKWVFVLPKCKHWKISYQWQ